jgi:hypothetical protein
MMVSFKEEMLSGVPALVSYGDKTYRILEFVKEKRRGIHVRVSASRMLIFHLIIMKTFSQAHKIYHLRPLTT